MSRLISSFVVFSAIASFAAPSFGQKADESANFPWEGEVTGANVYVRSGAGNNWYPTTKLNAGDRVLVLGEKFGWYQIAPPAGSISYIDISAVDRKAGGKTGTVRQDKVYVRAGSNLEPQRKSSTQVVLNKGASVEIVGEADGFYQISPPQGAALFMSKQYVKPVGARLRTGLVEKHVSAGRIKSSPSEPPPVAAVPANEEKTAPPPDNQAIQSSNPERVTIPADADQVATGGAPPTVEPTEAQSNNEATTEPPAENKANTPKSVKSTAARRREPAPAPAPPASTGRYKAMLTVVEGELADAMRRPFEDQDVSSLVRKYEPIANQTEESIPSQVARIRIRQLNDRAQLKLARLEIDKDSREIDDLRANMDKKRVEIMNRPIEMAAKRWDLEGELRRSFAFAPENRRYRLVDPKNQVTIAYVDVPTTVEANPEHLIGQFVGIELAGQKFSPSARVPIAVAKTLVDLSPRKKMGHAEDAATPGAGENSPRAKSNSDEETSDDAKAEPAGERPETEQ